GGYRPGLSEEGTDHPRPRQMETDTTLGGYRPGCAGDAATNARSAVRAVEPGGTTHPEKRQRSRRTFLDLGHCKHSRHRGRPDRRLLRGTRKEAAVHKVGGNSRTGGRHHFRELRIPAFALPASHLQETLRCKPFQTTPEPGGAIQGPLYS